MIRITLHADVASFTMQLEGKLTRPWVREAESQWQQAVTGTRKRRLCIDLTGVTLIDTAGKAFLAAARAEGAELAASGCLMRAIVQELSGGPLSGCECSQDLTEQTS